MFEQLYGRSVYTSYLPFYTSYLPFYTSITFRFILDSTLTFRFILVTFRFILALPSVSYYRSAPTSPSTLVTPHERTTKSCFFVVNEMFYNTLRNLMIDI